MVYSGGYSNGLAITGRSFVFVEEGGICGLGIMAAMLENSSSSDVQRHWKY